MTVLQLRSKLSEIGMSIILQDIFPDFLDVRLDPSVPKSVQKPVGQGKLKTDTHDRMKE